MQGGLRFLVCRSARTWTTRPHAPASFQPQEAAPTAHRRRFGGTSSRSTLAFRGEATARHIAIVGRPSLVRGPIPTEPFLRAATSPLQQQRCRTSVKDGVPDGPSTRVSRDRCQRFHQVGSLGNRSRHARGQRPRLIPPIPSIHGT